MNLGKFSEDQLIEQPAIQLLEKLGWSPVNALHEKLGPDGTLGRDNQGEVILVRHLRPAMVRLNPTLPAEAIEQAIAELVRDRSAMDPVRANREVYDLVKDGVPVEIRLDDGGTEPGRVRVVDWAKPKDNDCLLVSQFWVAGDMYKRRADLVGFVNGLPLLFIELKASHRKLEDAYRKNLNDYRSTVPRLFWPNGLIVLSNGVESRVGTVSSAWEHFAEWKKVENEAEPGVVSLETVLRGTCDPGRLLDLVENFTVFQERPRGLVKLVARAHQFLGVRNALTRLAEIRENPEEAGRLGVFWHTQGSGKTLSMLFFCQKVLRSLIGNWTFVIVTDRKDLDGQVYKEFSDAGVLTEGHVQANSGEHLRRLLGEDHRYVFTLIHKFRADRGETFPVLSDRSDVIVITDEAHRSQYDVLALNMRNALPNASFLGFTGTPLIAGQEEKTREVFGNYVSVYDFGESIRDGATVPLFYENRIPEMQLANESFDADLDRILEEAELDAAQEAKVSRLFAKQYQLITREDRLDRLAADLVEHFLGRGFAGKAMVIAIDKATAVRMYNKVSAIWAERLKATRAWLAVPERDPDERALRQAEADYMATTDMAVVVSQAQNEIADMAAKGLDIVPHRKRMMEEDLEGKFKDPVDPLRIVFVCAMWTTGFDVPSCSTIYLDKPMKNHTLMQTIARANRVFADKTSGLIVDYIGVFRQLEAALAIYAAPTTGGALPVADKAELVEWLRDAVDASRSYCATEGVDIDSLVPLVGLELLAAASEAVERLIVDDETKTGYLAHARLVDRLFKAILPDPSANEFGPLRAVIVHLGQRITNLNPTVDVSWVMGQIEILLDESVAANAYVIHGDGAPNPLIDLDQVDWQVLAEKFAKGKKRTEAERLRAAVAVKVAGLMRLNPSRSEWAERFQELIDEYNAGSVNVEEFFKRLIEFAKSLNGEERRALAEGLDEEQLAIYDLIMRPSPALTDAERKQVKKVAEGLLASLKRDKLVLDWRKEQRARAAVRLAVEEELDRLPEKFAPNLYYQKVDVVYEHIYDSYWDDGRSVYSPAA